jgi:hypothetical protein
MLHKDGKLRQENETIRFALFVERAHNPLFETRIYGISSDRTNIRILSGSQVQKSHDRWIRTPLTDN